MEVMVADRIKILKMEIGNMADDVLLNNRALWLKNEELSYLQKSKIKRKYLMSTGIVRSLTDTVLVGTCNVKF